MIDQLPRLLTTGVTATQEGLIVHNADESIVGVTAHWPCWESRGELAGYLHVWPDAAERLRYREGEPWCRVVRLGVSDAFENGMYEDLKWLGSHEVFLHRLAAILCDDAEAFRVLHWCVSHLAQEDSK